MPNTAAASRELPSTEYQEPEQQLEAESEADEFKAEVRFMFMIPTALFVFLAVCAAIMLTSP